MRRELTGYLRVMARFLLVGEEWLIGTVPPSILSHLFVNIIMIIMIIIKNYYHDYYKELLSCSSLSLRMSGLLAQFLLQLLLHLLLMMMLEMIDICWSIMKKDSHHPAKYLQVAIDMPM